jgi:hypothetical protein
MERGFSLIGRIKKTDLNSNKLERFVDTKGSYQSCLHDFNLF